jgi:transposase
VDVFQDDAVVGVAMPDRAVVCRGHSNGEVAELLGVHPTTVGKWRHRFALDRLDGLVDAPRPGAARTIGDDVIEVVLVESLETAPADATHWSTSRLRPKARDLAYHRG